MQFIEFDTSYLERLQAGDVHTERHFVSYFSELMRLKLSSRLRSKEAIEDVKQETFVRVLALVRSGAGVRQATRLGALVNSVCNHVLMEHYRLSNRHRKDPDDENEDRFVDNNPSALRLIQAEQTELMVTQILAKLTARDQRLLQSVLLEERDTDAVCNEFGISREYLRVLVHRAKQSFRTVFIKRFGTTNLPIFY